MCEAVVPAIVLCLLPGKPESLSEKDWCNLETTGKGSILIVECKFLNESEVKVVRSCPTLCDPMDYTVHGILQARILEWVALPFPRVSSQPGDLTLVSHIAGGFSTS